jgi:hypothetical protein
MNEFDNEITYKYRLANEYGVPIKYLYLENEKYFSVTIFISNMLNENFDTIYYKVNVLNSDISDLDILI